jgi:hypothetical protein
MFVKHYSTAMSFSQVLVRLVLSFLRAFLSVSPTPETAAEENARFWAERDAEDEREFFPENFARGRVRIFGHVRNRRLRRRLEQTFRAEWERGRRAAKPESWYGRPSVSARSTSTPITPRTHRIARHAVRVGAESSGGGSGDDGGSSDPAPKLTCHSFTATCCTPPRRRAK